MLSLRKCNLVIIKKNTYALKVIKSVYINWIKSLIKKLIIFLIRNFHCICQPGKEDLVNPIMYFSINKNILLAVVGYIVLINKRKISQAHIQSK